MSKSAEKLFQQEINTITQDLELYQKKRKSVNLSFEKNLVEKPKP